MLHLVRRVVSHCTANKLPSQHPVVSSIASPYRLSSHRLTVRFTWSHVICAWRRKYSAITASRDCTAVSARSWRGSAPDSSRTSVCTMQRGPRSSRPSGGDDDGGATTMATTTASPRGEAAPGRAPRVDCRRRTIGNALLGDRVPPRPDQDADTVAATRLPGARAGYGPRRVGRCPTARMAGTV